MHACTSSILLMYACDQANQRQWPVGSVNSIPSGYSDQHVQDVASMFQQPSGGMVLNHHVSWKLGLYVSTTLLFLRPYICVLRGSGTQAAAWVPFQRPPCFK